MRDAVRFSIDELEKSIKEQPLNVRNYFFLIDAYRLAGQYALDPLYVEKAEKIAQQALQLAPRRAELYRSMPELYVVKGDFKKAEEWAKKGIDYNISPRELHLFIATIWLQGKDFDKAFFELGEAEKNGLLISEKSNFPIYLATSLPAGQENKKAVEYVDRLVRETSGDPIASGAQAIVYHKTGRRAEAAKILGSIQASDTRFAEEIRQYMQ